jgi:hypothetical protein
MKGGMKERHNGTHLLNLETTKVHSSILINTR